jgi:hypothetical protein
MTTARKRKAGVDSDMILPLLEKENENIVVTEGTESDECSDETISGTEESGSNGGGGGDYDNGGNIVQAAQQIAIQNMRNLKQASRKPTGKYKFTGQ